MADELEAELNLSAEAALSVVRDLGGTIDDTLTASAATFSEAMSTAIGGIPTAEVEVAPVGEEAITAAIDTAIGGADTQLDLFADTSEAESQLSLFEASAEDLTISVDADTSDAQAALDDLSSSSEDAAGSTSSAAESARGFGQASTIAAAGAGLATGKVGELGAAAKESEGNFGIAAGSAIALGAGVRELFEVGVETTGALQRFNTITGEMGERILNVHVGNLTGDLDELARSLGTDDEAMRNASASTFQFAINSGESQGRAADFSSELNALALRAVALNPALGNAADVAETMSSRLARGGRFAASFGISLTAAEINARALSNTNKDNVADLSLYEKSAAAAQIATERYGNSLKQDIAAGADNAIIKQRALGEEIRQVIEHAATPIVMPIFDVIAAGTPTVETFAGILSNLAQAAIPVVGIALQVVEPFLTAFAEGLQAIGPGALQVAAALGIAYLAFQNIDVILGVTASIMEVNPFVLLAVGVTTAIGALGIFGDTTDEADQHLVEFTQDIEKANGVLDDTARKAARSVLEEKNQLDDLGRAGVTLDDVLKGTTETSRSQRDALDEMARATQTFIDRTQGSKEAITEHNGVLQGAGERLAAVRDLQKAYIDRIADGNPVLGAQLSQLSENNTLNSGLIQTYLGLAGSQSEAARTLKQRSQAGADDAAVSQDQAGAADDEAAARDRATKAVNDYKAALDELLGRHLSLAEAEVSVGNASDRVYEAFVQQVDESHNANQVDRDRLDSLIGITKAYEDLATSTFDQVNATSGVTAATAASDAVMHNFALTLQEQLTGFGLSADAAQALLDKLGLTPFIAEPAAAALGGYGTAVDQAALTAGQGATDIDAANMAIEASTIEHMTGAEAVARDKAQQTAVDLFLASLDAANRWSEQLSQLPPETAAWIAATGPAIAAAAPVGQASASGHEVGSAFSEGIASGIERQKQAIIAAAEAVSAEAAEVVREQLSIQSPSKVFMEIGEQVGAGLALGISSTTDEVASAAAALAVGAASIDLPTPPAGVAGAGDAAAMGRAFAAAIPGSFTSGGTTVIVVGSIDEAKKYLPPDVQDDPKFLSIGRR